MPVPQVAYGLIPRNYNTHPVGHYASIPPFTAIPLMTDAEIEAAIVRKNTEKSWLSDLRMVGMFGGMIPSRDQNGRGYCWMHSGVSANLLVRARDNQPYADLSAYAGACIIKGYRDEGGWGAEGVDWMVKNGIPTSKTWPQKSTNRSNDTPAMYTEAALYKPTGVWADIQPNNDRAHATCLCNDDPVVFDSNQWSHSICSMRLLKWGPNGRDFSHLIWNSWADDWLGNGATEPGTGILPSRDSCASGDGLVALITVRASQPI
jgi:hypothetical protein